MRQQTIHGPILVTALLSLIACSYQPTFYWPQSETRTSLAGPAHTGAQSFSLFLDGEGAIYPEDLRASVRAIPQCDQRSPVCIIREAPSVYQSFMNSCFNEPPDWYRPDTHRERVWAEFQIATWSAQLGRVKDQLHAATNPVLVVLLHGFANDWHDAREVYAHMEEHALRYQPAGEQFVFAEVYWNGGESAIGSWGNAQGTGPLVGQQLRRLINAVQEDFDIPIRVLTHSSGAFVAASLVGDAGEALPLAAAATCSSPENGYCPFGEECRAYANYRTYNAHARSRIEGDALRVPDGSHLRVGMLAPATGPLSFYHAYGDGNFTGTLAEGVMLIFGTNRRDNVTGKFRLFSPENLGATTLGAAREWVDHFACVRDGLGRRARVVGVDFAELRHVHGVPAASHAALDYLHREGSEPFFNLLFEDGRDLRYPDRLVDRRVGDCPRAVVNRRNFCSRRHDESCACPQMERAAGTPAPVCEQAR